MKVCQRVEGETCPLQGSAIVCAAPMRCGRSPCTLPRGVAGVPDCEPTGWGMGRAAAACGCGGGKASWRSFLHGGGWRFIGVPRHGGCTHVSGGCCGVSHSFARYKNQNMGCCVDEDQLSQSGPDFMAMIHLKSPKIDVWVTFFCMGFMCVTVLTTSSLSH